MKLDTSKAEEKLCIVVVSNYGSHAYLFSMFKGGVLLYETFWHTMCHIGVMRTSAILVSRLIFSDFVLHINIYSFLGVPGS